MEDSVCYVRAKNVTEFMNTSQEQAVPDKLVILALSIATDKSGKNRP